MATRVLDIFCGAGGSSAGARLAGANIVGGIDACDVATATFKDNSQIPWWKRDGWVLQSDLRPTGCEKAKSIFSWRLLNARTIVRQGLEAPFREKPADFVYCLNFARKLRPRWIVLENVVQLRSWRGYEPAVQDLRGLATRFIRKYWMPPISACPSSGVGFSPLRSGT